MKDRLPPVADRNEQERKAALRRHPKPKQTAGDRWAKRILAKYGLTPDDVAEKWAEQDGLCPICECDLTTKTWVIEHGHKREGRASFRGIACSYCNHRILGIAERGGFVRAVNVVKYLWPDAAVVIELIRRPAA